jgi:DNA-binding transcriptional regulator of glucitol operon
MGAPAGQLQAPQRRSRWWTKRAISLHLTLAVTFPGFLALGWWQLHRALGGNSLSWAYTFEWPFFACYAVYMWWQLVHDEDSAAIDVVKRAPRWICRLRRPQSNDESEDAALAEYNAHLAALRAYEEAREGPETDDH